MQRLIHLHTQLWYMSLWTPKNPMVSSEAYIVVNRAVCSRMWACVKLHLNSCEADCRWKMSQVQEGGINHWWTDRSEGRRHKESQETTNTLFLFGLDPLKKWRSALTSQLSGLSRRTTDDPTGTKRTWDILWQAFTINTVRKNAISCIYASFCLSAFA